MTTELSYKVYYKIKNTGPAQGISAVWGRRELVPLVLFLTTLQHIRGGTADCPKTFVHIQNVHVNSHILPFCPFSYPSSQFHRVISMRIFAAFAEKVVSC